VSETIPPRSVPDWHDYFMSIALEVARRSKDPNTQHGAVIVDDRHRLVSTGFNGGCRKIPDHVIDWSRPNKYAFVIHAEENALWHAQRLDLEGCVLYVTGKPCSRCMLRIAHVGIGTVVYGDTPSTMVADDDWKLTLRIADLAGVRLFAYTPKAGNQMPKDKLGNS
jgi:dCMP deaminase